MEKMSFNVHKSPKLNLNKHVLLLLRVKLKDRTPVTSEDWRPGEINIFPFVVLYKYITIYLLY